MSRIRAVSDIPLLCDPMFHCPLFSGFRDNLGKALWKLQLMTRLNAAVGFLVVSFVSFSVDSHAWNIPGHMLSGAIAYQILNQWPFLQTNLPVRGGQQLLVFPLRL
jgi:hypothetical protein